MVVERSFPFFHDDGRICLVYPTPEFWMMPSISISGDRDHFVLGYVPADSDIDDVATSSSFTALLFGSTIVLVSHECRIVKTINAKQTGFGLVIQLSNFDC